MEGAKTTNETNPQNGAGKKGRSERRRHADAAAGLRYYLPKSGTSAERPELGRELASEGEALVEAFRKGLPIFTLAAWEAVVEMNGGEPKIVKRALAPATANGNLKAS